MFSRKETLWEALKEDLMENFGGILAATIMFGIPLGIIFLFVIEFAWEVFIAGPIIVAALLILWTVYAIKSSYKQKLESERIRKQREEHQQRKKRLQEIKRLETDIPLTFERLGHLSNKIENDSLEAEQLFDERAFDPFWQHIEAICCGVKKYNEEIDKLKENITKYDSLTVNQGGDDSDLIDAIESIPSLKKPIERVNNLLYEAHRDFEFATIYEQRKTQSYIYESFTDLKRSIETAHKDLTVAVKDIADKQENVIERIREQTKAADEHHKELRSQYNTIEKYLKWRTIRD
jgi:hypothetical protein